MKLASIQSSTLQAPPIDPATILDKSYIMCPAPNALDVVGNVFAVDKNKAKYNVTTLTIAKDNGIIVLPKYSFDRTITVSLLAKFLGNAANLFSAEGSYDSSAKIHTVFEATENQVDRTSDLPSALKAVLAIKAQMADLNKSIPGLKYYMIIEVIKSKRLTITTDKGNANKIGLKGETKTIPISGGGTVSWDKTKGYLLDYKLDSPLTVFYKVVPVLTASSMVGSTINFGKPLVLSTDERTLYEKVVK